MGLGLGSAWADLDPGSTGTNQALGLLGWPGVWAHGGQSDTGMGREPGFMRAGLGTGMIGPSLVLV